MYTIYLDELTGFTKIVEPTNQGKKLYGTYATIQDFCSAFSNNAKVETPIVPPSCFKYASNGDGSMLFLFYPARDIKFEINYSGSRREFDLAIPNAVIKVQLSLPNKNKTLINKGWIYFTDAMIPSDTMKLYKPPFPNIYTDCSICFGGVNRGEYNMQNLFGIDAVHSMFFNNTANGDLFQRESLSTGKSYENPMTYITELSKLSKEDQFKSYFTENKFKTMFSGITI